MSSHPSHSLLHLPVASWTLLPLPLTPGFVRQLHAESGEVRLGSGARRHEWLEFALGLYHPGSIPTKTCRGGVGDGQLCVDRNAEAEVLFDTGRHFVGDGDSRGCVVWFSETDMGIVLAGDGDNTVALQCVGGECENHFDGQVPPSYPFSDLARSFFGLVEVSQGISLIQSATPPGPSQPELQVRVLVHLGPFQLFAAQRCLLPLRHLCEPPLISTEGVGLLLRGRRCRGMGTVWTAGC